VLGKYLLIPNSDNKADTDLLLTVTSSCYRALIHGKTLVHLQNVYPLSDRHCTVLGNFRHFYQPQMTGSKWWCRNFGFHRGIWLCLHKVLIERLHRLSIMLQLMVHLLFQQDIRTVGQLDNNFNLTVTQNGISQ